MVADDISLHLKDLWPRLIQEAADKAEFEKALPEMLMFAAQHKAAAPLFNLLVATHCYIMERSICRPPPFMFSGQAIRLMLARPSQYMFTAKDHRKK